MKAGLSGRLKGRMVLVLIAALALSACMQSPEAKSAKFMERGKKLLQKEPARAILEFRNAVRATPANAEAYYQLGLAYLAAHDVRDSVASLRKALDLNPNHQGAQLKMAQLMSTADDPSVLEDARKRLEALLQRNPEDADTLHALGLTELKLGGREQGVAYLERALAAAPQQVILAATVAQIKIAQNDVAGAERILKQAVEKSPNSAEPVILLGRFYFLSKRLKEADQQFQRALQLDPHSTAALFNLAVLELNEGQKKEAEQNFQRLSQTSDKDVNYTYGVFLFQDGRQAAAIQEFSRLAQKDPNDTAARTRLVAAYRSAQRPADAQKILKQALNRNPKDLDARLQRAELFLDAGQYRDAQTDLDAVVHLRPDSPEAHYALAKLDQARGASLLQRQELGEVLRLDPRLLPVRIELAQLLISGNSAQAALDLLDAAPAGQKTALAFVEERNWALLSLGRGAEARKAVDTALAVAHTPVLLIQDAELKIQERRYAEARKAIYEALAGRPDDYQALQLLVRSYSAEKRLPAAVQEVRVYADRHPHSAPVQYFLGRLSLETGDRQQARQAFAAAKAADAGYVPADLALAQINLQQANWKEARPALLKILAAKEDPTARMWLGMLEESEGNHSAAIAAFRNVVESQPDNAEALNNLAYLLGQNGGDQADEALKYAQKAQELAPTDAGVNDTLGWILYQKGLYQSAVQYLGRADGLAANARRKYHLAMACFKTGAKDRGRKALEAGLRLDSNLPEAKIAQQLYK